MRVASIAILALAINGAATGAPISQRAFHKPLSSSPHFGAIADPSVWPISAIGKVTVIGFSRRSACTGTLVAPKLVLTAAHCLLDANKLAKPGNVRFLTELNKGVPVAYSVAKRFVISSDFLSSKFKQTTAANAAAHDWALIVLKTAISIRPVTVKSITRKQFRMISNSHSFMQAGYGMDRPYLPSIVRDCHVSEGSYSRTFVYRCLTDFGYSGAPILAKINGTPSVIAIGSRGDPQKRLGIACSARQFEKAVSELQSNESIPRGGNGK